MKMACRFALTCLAGTLAMNCHAVLVSYDLNQSNVLVDGPAYLRVNIDDQGLPGHINFNVSVLTPLLDIAGSNFGIQQFGFNSDFSIHSSQVTGLPGNWRFDDGRNMAGFGRFDIDVESKTGNARRSSLSFSITGVSMDTISSYLQPSSGHAGNGNFFFAAHVAGFNALERSGVTSAWFAGSSPAPLTVPLPAAGGLLLGGLGLLALGRCRRRPAVGTGVR